MPEEAWPGEVIHRPAHDTETEVIPNLDVLAKPAVARNYRLDVRRSVGAGKQRIARSGPALGPSTSRKRPLRIIVKIEWPPVGGPRPKAKGSRDSKGRRTAGSASACG